MRDSNFRARLYESYASDHAGVDWGEAVRWLARRRTHSQPTLAAGP